MRLLRKTDTETPGGPGAPPPPPTGGPGARTLTVHDRAAADLRVIRSAIETAIDRSGRFTAVPGLGTAAMGATATVAAVVAAQQRHPRPWLAVWGVAAVVAISIGIVAMVRKARREGVSAVSGPGRRFLLCVVPPVIAAVLISAPIFRWGQVRTLPAVWMLLYGTGVLAAGALSVPVVPATGAVLLGLGAASLWLPAYGNLFLGLGFGVVHIIAGLYIARRHGG
jgi:hypothetical protein